MIYEHQPSPGMAAVFTLELCPSDGWGCVSGDVQSEDAGNIAATDIPFLLKLEVHAKTTCWPPNSQLIMTLNAQDKEKWMSGE